MTGTLLSQRRYLPYGETRWSSGPFPTDRRFTGQREEVTLGVDDYGARFYSPGLGRFLSADTLVPEAGKSQSLNRYAYVLGNPLRYTDPTGHFDEETQLRVWFGEKWRTLFSEAWQQLLLIAEFGDAVTYKYADPDSPMIVLFVNSDAGLVGWDIGVGNQLGKIVSLQDLARGSVEETMALYRSVNANRAGGPSDFPERPALPDWGFLHYQYIAGPFTAKPFLDLPTNWHMGSTCHVDTYRHVAGIDPGFSDIADLFGTIGRIGFAAWAVRELGTKMMGTRAGAAFGGWGAAIGLAVDVWDWLTWDTSFYLAADPGLPWPPPPVPTPPGAP